MEKGNLTDLSEFEDLYKGVAFHFTANQNIDSILKSSFRQDIGENSSGALGKEAIPKTFISYGLEGVMQMYNRLLNIALEVNSRMLNTDIHRTFLPNTVRLDCSKNLSVLEGLEFMRQYIENNSYLVIDCPATEYENDISYNQIRDINNTIGSLKFKDIPGLFDEVKDVFYSQKEFDVKSPNTDEYDLINEFISNDEEKLTLCIKKIDSYINKAKTEKEKEFAKKLFEERAIISIAIRKYTLNQIDRIRGKIVNENEKPIIEQYDYNEERLQWVMQIYNKEGNKKYGNPSNVHTRIVESKNGLIGLQIPTENLRVFSIDKENYANGVDFLSKLLPIIQENDKIANSFDCNLLTDFLEYTSLVDEYKKLGLLKREDKKIGKENEIHEFKMEVVDLENIDKYPGFEERFHPIEQSVNKKILEKALEYDREIKDVPSLIEKYETIDGVSEKINYIKNKIEDLDWDNSVTIVNKNGSKQQVDDVITMILYEFASSLEQISGVPLEQIVDKIASLNDRIRLGNWKSPKDDDLQYDGKSVTSIEYQNGKRKEFGAQTITSSEPGKPHKKSIVLYSNLDENGREQNGINLNSLNDIRQTLFHEWMHIMELEQVKENDDKEFVLNGRTFRDSEKLKNGEIWHTGLVTKEFGKNLAIVQNIDNQNGRKPSSRIMHNQITEGPVELIARKILAKVIGENIADKEIDHSRYLPHVKIAQIMMDSYGEKEFISNFITSSSTLTREFQMARIGNEDALHYMADFVDDQKGFQVIPEYSHRTAFYGKMKNIFESLDFSEEEENKFKVQLGKAEIEGDLSNVAKNLLKNKVNSNLNDSKLNQKTWAFLSELDEYGRNPIRAILDEYEELLNYEKEYYQNLPNLLQKALNKSRESKDDNSR